MTTTNKSLGSLIVLPFLALITLFTSMALDFSQTDLLAVLILYGTGCFYASMIYFSLKKHPFSIELIVWLFLFFFMFYAPLIQYTKQRWPWRGSLSHNDVIVCCLLCLLFGVVFCIGKQLYTTFSKGRKQPLPIDAISKGFVYAPLIFSGPMKGIVALISLALAVVFIARNGISGIVVSRADAVNPFYSGNSSAVLLLVDSCIPAFLAYGAAVSAQEFMTKKKGFWLFVIQLLCLLVCSFPTAIPRYKMACIYAPLAMVLFPALKKKTGFFWPFVLALFFILPVMSDVRYSLDFGAAISTLQDNFIGTYAEVDYDAFRMLSGTVKYVGKNGVTWGRQLLGSLLFFIPSSIWTGKPGGSGSLVIRALLGDDSFSNVSCPFVGEGYINFGLVGVILFALAFGYLAKKFDSRYWLIAEDRGADFSPYMYLIMLIFFMLRGDFLSSFAFIVGFMAVGYVMRVASGLLERKKV